MRLVRSETGSHLINPAAISHVLLGNISGTTQWQAKAVMLNGIQIAWFTAADEEALYLRLNTLGIYVEDGRESPHKGADE